LKVAVVSAVIGTAATPMFFECVQRPHPRDTV
jgi:hypothetical protein